MLDGHPERFELEELMGPSGRVPHQQLERSVGRLEVEPLMLEGLEAVDDLA